VLEQLNTTNTAPEAVDWIDRDFGMLCYTPELQAGENDSPAKVFRENVMKRYEERVAGVEGAPGAEQLLEIIESVDRDVGR
jgi:hypothetical protein